MLTLGYIRRSKKSDDKVVSVKQQEEKIAAYCATNGLQLVECVVHDGVSGGKRSRFDVIERRRVAVSAMAIVFYDLDRLARDDVGMLSYIERMVEIGVQLHETGLGQVDYRTAEGIFLTQVRGAANEFQKNITSRKTRHALAHLKSQGRRYTNIPPLGYCYRDGSIVPDPLEQVALRIIERCAAIPGCGARRTRAELKRQGYSGRMSLGAVHKQLQSIKEKLPATYFAAL